MPKPKFKLKLTIEERILLHIRNYAKYEYNLQAPFALTQDGVAKAVSVVRSAIPRSMKKLVDKGLVKEQVGHVEGVVRRRKIYYLTTEGLIRAQEITEKLEGVKCHVKNVDDEVKELKLSDVNKFLGTNFSILEILEGLDEDGIFDYPAYTSKLAEGKKEAEDDLAFISFTEKAPRLDYFFGRNTEIEKIQDWITGSERRIIVVHGIAGIGKTTLALKILEEFKSKMHIIWYRFHQWDTLRYFIKNLSQFLDQLGRRELKRYIDTEPVLDMNTIAELLEAGLKDLRVLVIVDDFHKAKEEIHPVFTYFVELLERLSETNVLIFSRHVVPFYDRRHVRVKKIVGEHKLEGLTRQAASELLKHRGIIGTDFNVIYKLTSGHPLSLELLESGTEKSVIPKTEDLNIYIQEEIFSKLPEEKRKVLALSSVYRYGAPRDILLEQTEGGIETLNDLISRALLEYSFGTYSVHDLISEFFYETQPLSVRKKNHSQAADYYLEQIEDSSSGIDASQPETLGSSIPEDFDVKGSNLIEALHHLIKSERFKEAGAVVAGYGEYLIESDLGEELRDQLMQLPIDKLKKRDKAMVLLYFAEVYYYHRDFEAASNYYIESLENFRLIHGESREPKKMALIYRRLGLIYERKNDWNTAREHHEISLELAEKAKDAMSISDAYGALAWVHWNSGDHDLADDYYNKCIGSADKISDMPGKAKVYLGICMSLAKRGELEEAIQYYEKCLDILERNEDIFKLAKSTEGMGDHYLRSIFSHFMQSNQKKIEDE